MQPTKTLIFCLKNSNVNINDVSILREEWIWMVEYNYYYEMVSFSLSI